MFKSYFVWLITIPYSASHWTIEGRFCCICDLLTLKVSPHSHYRQWFCSLITQGSYEILPTLNKLISEHKVASYIVRVCDHASASNFCMIFVLLLMYTNWYLGLYA